MLPNLRRLRLAERLLTDVINLTVDRIESAACTFEHVLNEEEVIFLLTGLSNSYKARGNKIKRKIKLRLRLRNALPFKLIFLFLGKKKRRRL